MTKPPVANGLSTDHPIPGLPFVDDRHLPLDDPQAIERIGRGRAPDMWGRCDGDLSKGDWWAFTTDADNHEVEWSIRRHPDHGRSVVLFAGREAARTMHDGFDFREIRPLLFRHGGYWWDGHTWYRPLRVFDETTGSYARRAVNAAQTLTAHDLLVQSGDPAAGTIYDVGTDLSTAHRTRWADDLALWREHRTEDEETLRHCIVTVHAPELSADRMIGIDGAAERADIHPSTLRSYLTRGQADVPEPQATIGSRRLWAEPVIDEWIEARSRSTDTRVSAVTTGDLPDGQIEARDHFAGRFGAHLLDRRRDFVLKRRGDRDIGALAADLGTIAALSLDAVLPIQSLAATVRDALIRQLNAKVGAAEPIDTTAWLWIHPDTAISLDWMLRHAPDLGIGIITTSARETDVPGALAIRSIHTALKLDGRLDPARYDHLFDSLAPPPSDQ